MQTTLKFVLEMDFGAQRFNFQNIQIAPACVDSTGALFPLDNNLKYMQINSKNVVSLCTPYLNTTLVFDNFQGMV